MHHHLMCICHSRMMKKFEKFFLQVRENELNFSLDIDFMESILQKFMLIHSYYFVIYEKNKMQNFEINNLFYDWDSCLRTAQEICFNKKEYFSNNFVEFFEAWSCYDVDYRKLYFLSIFNDFCRSEEIYKIIKDNRHQFSKNPDGEDDIDLWESAVFLFEKYDKDSFSNERYNRVYG